MKKLGAFASGLVFFLVALVGGQADARKPSTASPDLTIAAVSAPSSASSGAAIVVSSSIQNQGRGSSGAFRVAFYLAQTASSTSGATILGTQDVTSLPAGTSMALVTSLTIPASTPSGTFYIVGFADSTNVVRESNENNNIASSGAISVKDSTPPTISGVTSSGITSTNAPITWTTDKASTSQVVYGASTAYGSSTALNSSLLTSHAITLSGLSPSSLYHFRVQSKDTSGNAAISNDYTFTTSSAAASATTRPTYYVAPTGSDANPGTAALPFRTIVHGVSVLTPGDTLYIMSGTYAEALIDSIPPGTSWDSPVTVAAAPGHTVTLKPSTGAGWVLHFQGPQQYIVIDGLILDATNVTYDAVKITAGGGAGPAHHIRLQNSEVRNAPGQGVLVSSVGADWNEFINLNVHHNGLTEYDHGFYIESSRNVVENCSIHDNAGYGVHIYNGYTGRRADGNLVRNNKVFTNGWRGILLGSGDGNVAYNNLVWGNRGGIRVNFSDPTNSQVYYNTVYGNTDWGILVQAGTGAVVQNNIVYMNGAPELQNTATGSVIAHNLVGIDPQFVNAAAGDFRLQPDSVAIDAGIAVSSVTTDIAGTLRPQGRGDDIGAFEAIP